MTIFVVETSDTSDRSSFSLSNITYEQNNFEFGAYFTLCVTYSQEDFFL